MATPTSPSALRAALRWIELGFFPVPVPSGKKDPSPRAWQQLRIDDKSAAKYFNGARQNIGILLGDERNTTDVDCDCEQAISAARALLPRTKCVFGRKSKPSSHYFFFCDSPVIIKRYRDPVDKKKTIVELRGQTTKHTIGLQTIVPPSIHVSGEKIRFEDGCSPEPANVRASAIERAVEKVAAAALLAIHWPAQGRHDCELALAGVLARNHWNEEEAVEFVLAAYTSVPDHDASKLGRVTDSVRDTFANVRSNSPATGLPSLAEHLSVPVSNALCDWLHLDRGARQAGPGEEQACRFFCDERGVWAEEKERKPQFICPPLWIEARTSDFNDEGWGKLVRFLDPRSNEKTCIIPMAQLLGDNHEAIQRLVSSGFQPRSDPKSLRQLKQYISQAQPENFVTCIQRVGWHGEAFVFPEKIIGDTQKRFLFHGESAHKYRKAGTLEQWKTEIARYCSGNSRLLFVTSCAFAAPLIELVKTDNAGVHLRGITSTGKTTATRVGGSVVGGDGSARGFMESWRSTANGLEMQALLHNDMLLPLDEIAEIDERMVGEVVYMLGNGSTKGRATRTLSSRPSVQFRTLFTSTGERTLTEMMTAAGKVVKGGQEVRLIDIEADAGRKLGVFEKLHGFDSGQHLADYLTRATTKYYGTAITAFLEHVVAQRPSVIDRIQRGRENFVQACIQKGSASEVSRAASFFGLVALAGEEATACGITGWQRGEAHDAAMRLFRDWVHNRGGIGSHDIDAGIRAVVAFLQSNLSRFQNLDRQDSFLPRDRAGFCETDEEDGSIVHYIFPHVFEKEICGAYDHRAIARAMVERGYLKRQKAANFAIQKRLEGKPQRVYAVLPDIFDYDREADQNSPPSLFQPEKVVTVGTGGVN